MRIPTCVLTAVLLAGGCSYPNPYGSSTHAVSGKLVAPSGEVVKGGAEVVLTPKSTDTGIFGRDATGEVRSDGTFALKTAAGEDVPGGTYQVVVRPYGKASPAKSAAARLIPKRLWAEETSDLVVEVTGDRTGWELRLTK
jgi:hypothetical protein